MNHFAGPNSLYSPKQLLLDHLIVTKLIFRNAHYNQPNPELRDILLKFKLAVDRHQRIELALSSRQQCPVSKRTPPLVMNCRN